MGNVTQTKKIRNCKHFLLENDHLECRVEGRGREWTEREKRAIAGKEH
jgi:translation initiation factor IF-3